MFLSLISDIAIDYRNSKHGLDRLLRQAESFPPKGISPVPFCAREHVIANQHMESTTADKKKRLGVYYTPDEATSILARWAVQSPSDHILEPSFGGCSFLQAVVDALRHQGCAQPIKQVYGFDIHRSAFSGPYESLVRQNGAAAQFMELDFLTVTPEVLQGPEFNVVIGNPPYVSHHNMGDNQRETVRKMLRNSEFSLDRKASLWAYFVLHGLEFLAEGGRMAWVLPGSFFHSDYAESISDVIASNFRRAVALQLGERIFREEGAEECSVVLLADGWCIEGKENSLKVGYVPTLKRLAEVVTEWEQGKWKEGRVYNARIGSVLMSPEAADAMQTVEKQCRVIRFEDVADVKIGIVTGANRFFVIDQAIVDEHNLKDSDWRYIFSKSKIAEGISVTEADLNSAREKGLRCLLINTKTGISDALQTYLDQWSEEEIESNVTFGKREVWHQPDDEDIPDAFFPYMQHVGPRLVLNDCRVNSTNTIHRVYFGDNISRTQQRLITVSLLSTYSQLSAELEGRTYGSGVLKHELHEARAIQLILLQNTDEERVGSVFQCVDNLLRQGEREHARQKADEFVLGNLPQPDRQRVVQTLRKGLQRARERRKGARS